MSLRELATVYIRSSAYSKVQLLSYMKMFMYK